MKKFLKQLFLKTTFEIGPVEDDDYGIGYVISTNSGVKNYPIEVEFQSDNSRCCFTADGREYPEADITLKKSNHNWKP